LLQLTTQDLEQRVEQELIDNPALETGKEDEADYNLDEPETKEDSDDIEDDIFDKDDLYDISEYTDNQDDSDGFHLYEDGGEEDKKEMPIPMASTFYENLLEQINAIVGDDHEKALAEQLVGSIDEDGYLRRPLPAIVNDLAFSQNISTSTEELEKVLEKIHRLDPPGIGARDLQECLLLQLRRKDKDLHPEVDLAIRLLKDYMDDFTKKHYEKLMRSLKVTEDQLRDAIQLITKLNPKPGETSTSLKGQYIVPDFILIETDNGLDIQLNSRNAPELKISRSYMDTLKTYEQSNKQNKELKDTVQFIKQKLDGAKWFIDSIKQRQNTLLTTMRAILEFQREFFEDGDETKLKPMILKDIADEVGLDVSTISRVANSKYVQTDFGIIPLKFFFSEGITTADGEEVSNKEVKKILKDAIEAEDKSKPLPDEKLMEILKDKGYNIARRTVAKYREQLNIPVARLRKQL
ncbi:MAG: RNA polymerase factor sigma-54, partial [Bacteroidota bacterium]|nr:RNA polymerase factor sigma-54 [Bacteroidota bacterium]MDX5431158.1 RNA polymerase factor sigma-54 [Bacteroidota bacterium]MDX5469900.1 RNA polymerase factor sigma-54 [Bacteroidota bacterium]